MRTWIAFFALAIVFAALGATPARAADDCAEACLQQWLAERQACLDQLNTKLEEIENAARTCIAACQPTDYMCQAGCTRTANQQRATAQRNFRTCSNHANTTGWNCYRACQQSQSKP